MTTSATTNSGTELLQQFSDELATVVAQAGRNVATVHGGRRWSASGIYWRSGILVTANHTLKREDEISVTLADGQGQLQTLNATLVGRDSSTDLALLKLQTDNLEPLAAIELANANSAQVGQLVLALGRGSDGAVSASLGIISTLGSGHRWPGSRRDLWLRPALSLYPGASGGSLVNMSGQVVGMNTSGPHYAALTLPASLIDRTVSQVLGGSRLQRGYLGLGMQPLRLPESLQAQLPQPQTSAVIIISLESGSPAERAGILLGDILLQLGDAVVRDLSDLYPLLEPEQVGKTLTAQVLRGGTLVSLPVTIGTRPESEV